MARERELPHIIHRNLNHEGLVTAIQQNFDHVIGEAGSAVEIANRAVSNAVEQAAEQAATTVGLSQAEIIARLNAAGVGFEDGAPPTTAPGNLRAQGGIGNWFMVLWDGVANTSPVTYKVYADTVNGFTAADNTYVGSFLIPGGSGALGSLIVRTFPSTHRLPNHAVATGTTYYVRARATDASGDGPLAAQVSVSPLKVDASTVLSAGTIVGNLILAGEIATGHLATGAVTAGKISVADLAAINVNAGTLTAGTLNGLNFYGGVFQSSTGANYVSMSSAIGGAIDFFTNNARIGRITGGIGAVGLEGSNLVDVISISNNQAEVMAAATLKLSGTISGTFKHVGADLGFFSKAPVAKQADPGNHTNTDGTSDDGPARTKINEILGVLRAYGLL